MLLAAVKPIDHSDILGNHKPLLVPEPDSVSCIVNIIIYLFLTMFIYFLVRIMPIIVPHS